MVRDATTVASTSWPERSIRRLLSVSWANGRLTRNSATSTTAACLTAGC